MFAIILRLLYFLVIVTTLYYLAFHRVYANIYYCFIIIFLPSMKVVTYLHVNYESKVTDAIIKYRSRLTFSIGENYL